ncbi:MAG TPA: phosphoribosylglycinamide formyltransferase [Anaerolineales bacterium]|nr:phosphoribosylglycinamide formyltransferase [Anaerolineales bacterium]
MTRLVVLISGNGSNLQAILDACADGRLAMQVVAVLSNKADAYGLERARQAGVPAMLVERLAGEARAAYDVRLAQCVRAFQPDWVVLAGWMRLLSQSFLQHFPMQVINLHPALPGQFAGTHAIQRAFHAWQAGEISATGVMVHFVPDEGVDNGPLIAQASVPILPGDNLTALESRIHQAEHRLLISALQSLCPPATQS